jgi:hypothetical protein
MENLFKMSKKNIVLGVLFILISFSQDEKINNELPESTTNLFSAKMSSNKLNVFKDHKSNSDKEKLGLG